MVSLVDKLVGLPKILDSANVENVSVDRITEKAQDGIFMVEELAAVLKHKALFFAEIMEKAKKLNEKMYAKEIDFYAVSYLSDFCINSCNYCGHNQELPQERSVLTAKEMEQDFDQVLKYGPAEICILAGEDPRVVTPEFLVMAGNIAKRSDCLGKLERINFNVAPMSVSDFQKIRAGIDHQLQFRVFQESYDPVTYGGHHPSGPKKNFEFRVNAQERALEAGFDEVGIGTLLGLNCNDGGHDYEILSLIAHAYHIKEISGKFPQSISIPRHQKIPNHCFATPNPVDDLSYIAYHGIIRLALPETRIIVTNRERTELRDILRPMINIEDLAARPGVGGNYKAAVCMQNELGDARGPEELITDLRSKGYKVKVRI
ncbi:hypothetical protein HOE37_03465 [Candidatus Woesearchaeota archaeon]|jgi:2-iminoacetate synthase|nr:hypothetical protein [Candidatus Woesearchaeota archaeon]MBT4110889.1 hypothetical protein [Candidatus Woesearchaeota archaeon]MBT4336599.1 hypothetical protein [Candidatus Woesearchaeota archaeon]MBT4469652.1 hypothetical protein [Candidatus Woesearchaeota archaeon]MBT6744014.1 hypothetical protein [Candidatus Woesearchaeota archaeon]